MIDIIKAEEAFKRFVSNYDVDDEKVQLKIRHTYGVVEASKMLSTRLKLSEEDANLSKLIALLHDIGRFDQASLCKKIYDNADRALFDHAEQGVKILFDDGKIRDFIEDDSYDSIIRVAILNHNKYKIEEGLTEKELLHAKLIRDNDKIDNFRVKQEENFKVLLGTDDMDAIENEVVTKGVADDFLNGLLVDTSKTVTCLDRWICYIAFIFDLNYKESLEYVKENNIINKLFERINYKNKDTIETMGRLQKFANEYVNNRV
mgnify:CR=1 FL=1